MTTKLEGVSRRWQLRKRYGYFEKVVAVRAAAAAAACSMTPPALPRRKIFGHKNPRYIASLRADLEAYMRRVVELLHALTCGLNDLPPDAEALQHLLGLLDLVAPSCSFETSTSSRASARETHDAAAERLWNRTLHDAVEARRLLQGVGTAAGSAPHAGADAWANAGWNEEECDLLLEAGLVVQWVEAGELVMSEGEPANCFGVLLRGGLQAAAGGRSLGAMRPGAVLGALAPFHGGACAHDVTATSEAAVAIMGCRQLERMRRAEDGPSRSAAAKLNALLARCALADEPRAECANPVESTKVATPVVPAAILRLLPAARAPSAKAPPAELARLYAQQAALEQAAAGEEEQATPALMSPQGVYRGARTPCTVVRRDGEAGGEEGGEAGGEEGGEAGGEEPCVAVQGEVRLEPLGGGQPPWEWARHWAVLAGSSLHLYASPQAVQPRGVLQLSEASGLRCQVHDGTTSLVLSQVGVSRAPRRRAALRPAAAPTFSTAFSAGSRPETLRWAEALRAHRALPPSDPPHLAQRQAELQLHGSGGPPTGGAASCGLRAIPREKLLRLARLGAASEALVAPLSEAEAEAAPLSWDGFEAAQRALVERQRAVEHPFACDLETGLTVWELSRASRYTGLRRVCVLEPTREGTCGSLALRSDSCYVMLNARACGPEGAATDAYADAADADDADDADASSRTEDLSSSSRSFGRGTDLSSPSAARGDDLSAKQLSIEIHFWVGEAASADAAGAAAIVALHLVHSLEHEARTHREEMRHESVLFRSYFAPGELSYEPPPPPPSTTESCDRSHLVLWPATPELAAPVLYHVQSAAAPPGRVDLAACAAPTELLERGGGAFVLDVLEAASSASSASGGGTRRQYVWGSAELADRPAAAERMAAALFARSLHFCDHHGASELVHLADAPRADALRGPRAAAGTPRTFSGEVRSLLILRVRAEEEEDGDGDGDDDAAGAGRPSRASRSMARPHSFGCGTPLPTPVLARSEAGAGTGAGMMSPPSVGFMVVERARLAELRAEAEADGEARRERLAVEAFEPELQPGARPPAALLRCTDVVVLATEGQVHVWSGAHTLPYQRWAGAKLGAALAAARRQRAGFALRRVAAGCEDAYFRALFAGWPLPPSVSTQLAQLHPTAAMVATAPRAFVPAALPEWPLSSSEVTALLRADADADADADAPLLAAGGKADLVVWEVSAKGESRRLPESSRGIFRSDCCYMLLHAFTPAPAPGGGGDGARTKRHALVFWVGRHAERFRFLAWKYQHAQIIRGRAPNLRELLCEQGREPPEFFALFRKPNASEAATDAVSPPPSPLVFLHCDSEAEGASAARSRDLLDGMFDVGGHAGWRACAVQVARSAASLNSFSSFVIQSPTMQLVWHGQGSKPWRRQAAEQLAAEACGERKACLVEEGGETWGGGEGGELWASLEGGEACFQPSRLAAADCDAPRLFRCRSASGVWEVEEVRGFGQADLLAQYAYVLDGASQCLVWQGGAARPLDVRTALGFAKLYLQAAAEEEGLPAELRAPTPSPSLVAMGEEPREFTDCFHAWRRGEHGGAARFVDPHARLLRAAGRDEMFGRAIEAGEGGVSQQWLAEVEGDAPLEQQATLDHVQPLLELCGLTLVVTSLGADRRKQRRCARIVAVLERERLPHQVIDLAAPQHRGARLQLARLLRDQGRPASDALALPLLLNKHEPVVFGDGRAERGWSSFVQADGERRLSELLGAALHPSASSLSLVAGPNSRSLSARISACASQPPAEAERTLSAPVLAAAGSSGLLRSASSLASTTYNRLVSGASLVPTATTKPTLAAGGAAAGSEGAMLSSKRASSKLRRRSDVAAAFGSGFGPGATAAAPLQPPSTAVACGLLHACQTGRGKPARFCVLRDGMLLFYDPTKLAREHWEQMRTVAGASSGGWAPNELATKPNAPAAELEGAAAAGVWLVPTEEDLWGRTSKLGGLIDVFHPKAVVPLSGSLVRPVDEVAEQHGFALSVHGLELKLLCASAAERGAWLGALRTAQGCSPQAMYAERLGRELVERARAHGKLECDEWERRAATLQEEAAVAKAGLEQAELLLGEQERAATRGGVDLAEERERAREAGVEARRGTVLAEERARQADERVSALLLEQKEQVAMRAAADREAAEARTAMEQIVQRAEAATQQAAADVAATSADASEAKGVAEERVRQLEALIEAQRVELLRLRGAGVMVADAPAAGGRESESCFEAWGKEAPTPSEACFGDSANDRENVPTNLRARRLGCTPSATPAGGRAGRMYASLPAIHPRPDSDSDASAGSGIVPPPRSRARTPATVLPAASSCPPSPYEPYSSSPYSNASPAPLPAEVQSMRSQLLLEQAQLQERRAQQRLQRSSTAATPGGIAATPGAWLALGACMQTPAGGNGGSGGNDGSGGDNATITLAPASGHPTTPGMPRRHDAALYDSSGRSSGGANSSTIGGDAACENTPAAAPILAPSHHGDSGSRGGGGSSSSSSSPLPDNSNAPGSVTPGSASSGSTEPMSPDVEGLQRAPSAMTPSVVEMQRELQTVQRELQDLHRKREKRKTR